MQTRHRLFSIGIFVATYLAVHTAFADIDCPELASAMKTRTGWWRENDFSSALEEWIKKSDYSQFKNKSHGSLNIGVVLDDVPIQLGADTSEDEFKEIKNKLAAGKKLSIVSHTREQFVEESLSSDAMDVLVRCIMGQGAGFKAMTVRRKDKETVTLVLLYRPIPGSSGEQCKIEEIDLTGLRYANEQTKSRIDHGLVLTPGKETLIQLKREKGTGDVEFVTGLVTVTPSIGSPSSIDIDPIKVLKRDTHPPGPQWKDSKLDRFVFGNSEGFQGAGYIGVSRGQGISGRANVPLGVHRKPRIQDGLPANVRWVDGGGVWAPNGQPLFSAKDMGVVFTDFSWDEENHVLSFKYDTTAARNTRLNLWEVHAGIKVEVLTKEEIR